MPAGKVKVGTRYPTRQEVAIAHRRSLTCWACGAATEVSIAASADWDGGLATDPSEYGLLCSNCHLKAPVLGSSDVFWAWLNRHGAAHGRSHRTIASLLGELDVLPAMDREDALTRGLGVAEMLAMRVSPEHPQYREDTAERTFGEVFEDALTMVVGWLHAGNLTHRMEHPEEVLTEGELQRYEVALSRMVATPQRRAPRF